MGKIIGINAGTPTLCLRAGKRRCKSHRKRQKARARAYYAPSIVAYANDGEPRRSVGQAPGCDQSAQHPVRGEAFDQSWFDEEVVQKDIKMVPFKIAKADNGDAWI